MKKGYYSLSLSLSLSHVWFLCEFFVFFVFLLYIDVFMCSLEFYFGLQFGFVFLSYYLFFFSIIVKYYFIAYEYSLQVYNFILLYIMVWIIWCLTYNNIFYLILLFLILFYISLQKKVITLSLSLSLSLYIYIYIYLYSFLQFYFRMMNHCIFYIMLFWVNTIWKCAWFFKFSITSLLSPSFSFCLIFFFFFWT